MPTITDPRPNTDKTPWLILIAFGILMALVTVAYFIAANVQPQGAVLP